MELEMSSAITASTPLRFTVSILEPNCGRANMKMVSAKAEMVSQNFTSGLYLDMVGINSFSKAGSPYLRMFWRLL